MDVLFWCIFALGLFFLYILSMSIVDEVRKNRWRLRWNWGYCKRYSWRHKFAFGTSFGPLLFYKNQNLVYYRQGIPRELCLIAEYSFIENILKEAHEKFLNSIPYDFSFPRIKTFSDYSIDTDTEYFTYEGVPEPKKNRRK